MSRTWESWIQTQNSRPLDEQRIEYLKCAKSPAYFIHNYVWVKDERTGQELQFRLWKFQRWLLAILLQERLLCILKSRQVGISWLMVSFVLWVFTFHANRYSLLFSHRQEEAQELLDRCEFVYGHLPPWLQVSLSKANELELGSVRGSLIKAFPTRGAEGRTYAASVAIVDEAGTVAKLLDLITGLEASVGDEGRMIVLGTARGVGDFFTLIQRIRAGTLGAWRFVFLPWSVHPERGPGWRDARLEVHPEKWRVYQEYPETVDEAWQLGHRTRFDTERVKGLLGRVRQPLPLSRSDVPAELWPYVQAGELQVWRRPKPGKDYLIAADTAEGLPDGDRCAAVVQDRRTGLAVAELAGLWPDHIYAHILALLGKWYGWALMAIERNNTGQAVLANLVNVEHYRGRKYRMRSEVGRAGRSRRWGWITTTSSKPVMFDALDQALHDDSRRWYSERFLGEAMICAHRDDGTVGAPEIAGAHDDVLIAYCIAEAVRQEQRYMTGS